MKIKVVYPIIKKLKCPRCGQTVKHTLFDKEYSIYKCSNCGNIHE